MHRLLRLLFTTGGLIVTAMSSWSAGVASVPLPFTPVRSSAAEFGSLGRTTRLGPMLLPTQIESEGQPMLASPVRLVAEPDSALGGLAGEGRVIENRGVGCSGNGGVDRLALGCMPA